MDDAELAVELVEAAGRLLMELRGRAAELGLDEAQLKKEGGTAAPTSC